MKASLCPLLTANEAAETLRISQRKLWSLTNCGEIPCVRIGRSVRYDLADLQRWIEQRKEAGR
jgi:excisionase family DNA binding protein